MTDDGGLGQDDRSRSGKWLESGYVLKVEPKGFTVKSEREKQIPYANTYIWNLKKEKKMVRKT